ncbi:MAG TPA: biopolymer transporter ExbD [Pirellulaceae bacterium]|nr:biopolymer transporter ExbD [Pirellulaceae bacterium]
MKLLQDSRKLAASESDMTPMVDVTFLLLIFFMVTAAFAMQRSMVVPKPGPEGPVISAVAAERQADITVEFQNS